MRWQQLELTTTEQFADSLAELLTEHGALAVSFKDAADQPLFQLLPDETPLWRKTQVLALFDEHADVSAVLANLDKQQASQWISEHTVAVLEDQDWVRETQRHFPPQCFADQLWVIPSWCDASLYAGAKIVLDPGLAFGTGTHPTTALCLRWLAEHPPQAKTVIDYGCGSGILALASLALAAKHVYAIDHDPQALEATTNNAQLNAFDRDRLTVLLPEQVPNICADLVIANILSQPLIELATQIGGLVAARGHLILSGLLAAETDQVVRAYAEHFMVVSARYQEEWVQLTLMRCH